MSTFHLSPDAAAARERSRSVDGRFGTQSRPEADLELTPESMIGRVTRIGAEADQLLDRSREIERDRQQLGLTITDRRTRILQTVEDTAQTVDCPRYLALRMGERILSRGGEAIKPVGRAGEARAAGKRLAEALKAEDEFTETLQELEQLQERDRDLSAQAAEFRTASLNTARQGVREHDLLAGRVDHYRSAAAAAADRDAVVAQGGTGQIEELSVLTPGALAGHVRRTEDGTNLYTSWEDDAPLQRVLAIEIDPVPGATTVSYRYADGSTRQVGTHHAQGHTVHRGPVRAVVDTGATAGEPVPALAGVLDTTG